VSISGDGRYVLFDSWATNLVAGTTTVNGVYVHDRQTGVTTRVSVNSSGEESNADASLGTISADGRWVSFSSSATNLVPNDTNGASDVFLHDRQTGETTCVSVDPNGLPGNQFSSHSALSTDARYVAYRSAATNLVPGDTNLAVDVFVYERLTGDVTRESVDSSGVQATGDSFEPSLSADGRFVAFHSDAANLVASDTNAALDVFVRDRSTNQTTCASVTQSGNVGDAQSYQASISPDGRYVAFASEASLLVLGDANLVLDVYLRDRGEVPITRFCAGDATLAPCPCDNTGDPGRGCASSLFAAGGSLNGSGTPSVAADTLLLQSQDLTGTHCVFAQSDAQTPATVIDDGLGCLSGTLIRLGTNALVGGTTTYPQAGDLPVSVKGQIGPTGGTRYYQAYYRNAAAAFCPPAFSNRTNGLIVIWSP
jgi:hypothetical protein